MMRKQTYFYLAIVCSVAVIVLNLADEKQDMMNKIGIVLGVVAIIVSTVILISINKNIEKK
jgi:Na+(H+)/acetate symporter ActP